MTSADPIGALLIVGLLATCGGVFPARGSTAVPPDPATVCAASQLTAVEAGEREVLPATRRLLDGAAGGGPTLETREGWDIDGQEYKAREEFTATPIDWRGLVKNPGQLPTAS